MNTVTLPPATLVPNVQDAAGTPPAVPSSFDYPQLHSDISAILAKDLFFIGAHPKSGTTWLQVMLNAHPEISCSGEGHFLNRLAPLLEAALNSHNDLITRKNGSIFREFPPFPTFGQEHFGYLLTSAIAMLLLRSDDWQRARAIGEKTPDNALYFPQLAALFPRARFLYLIRDGRDCAVSSWFHNLRVNPEETQRRYQSIDDFVPFIAKSWQAYIAHGMHFCLSHKHRCLVVRYETLGERPQETMRLVFRFLGVDTAFGVLRRCVEAGRFETLSGGRAPGVEDRASFLRQGKAGNWQRHFSPEANRAFLDTAGEVMTQLGYPH